MARTPNYAFSVCMEEFRSVLLFDALSNIPLPRHQLSLCTYENIEGKIMLNLITLSRLPAWCAVERYIFP